MLRRLLLSASAALMVVLALAACVPEPPVAASSPSASRAPVPVRTPTPSPSATPTPTPTPTFTAVTIDCNSITTDAFRSAMLQTGWVSWETQNELIGAKPFALFPNGAPDGQLVCRWGLSPDVVSNNVFDMAWAPIDSESAVAAMQVLADQGFTRIEASLNIYYALPGGGDRVDAEGWGTSYLFTRDDVRWAPTKADLAYITAPGGDG